MSTSASHVLPHYSMTDKQPTQQYQAWSAETSEAPLVSNSNTK